MNISVLSVDIETDKENYNRDRIDHLVNLLHSTAPDVMCLQGTNALFVETATKKLSIEGYINKSTFSREYPDSVIYSKYQIKSTQVKSGVLFCEMKIENEFIWISTVRVSSVPSLRTRQFVEIESVARERSLIFAGNTQIMKFNECYISPPSNLDDAFECADEIKGECTISGDCPLVPCGVVNSRPDRVLHTPHFITEKCEVISDNDNLVSTHYPLFVNLTLV